VALTPLPLAVSGWSAVIAIDWYSIFSDYPALKYWATVFCVAMLVLGSLLILFLVKTEKFEVRVRQDSIDFRFKEAAFAKAFLALNQGVEVDRREDT